MERTTLLILGASGDLTSRLLLPALAQLLQRQPGRELTLLGAGMEAWPKARWDEALRQVFAEAGCAACHRPRFTIGAAPDHPEQAGQTVFPYTDLLLHDLGEGLADHRPEGAASGTEWRTTPLWGLGLTETVSGHSFLLHDGRARSVLEAILWHGGEAQAARDRVVALPAADRDALLRFLHSL